MNAEQTKQAAEIMLAWAGGKVIEAKPKLGSGIPCADWGRVIDPVWDFPCYDYRVKPEPRRLWIVFYPGDSVCCARANKLNANMELNCAGKGAYVKEFVEVLP